MREELDMLFLLEHPSFEDLIKAEEEHIDDECTETIMTREYDVYIDDSWMHPSFESLIFNKD